MRNPLRHRWAAYFEVPNLNITAPIPHRRFLSKGSADRWAKRMNEDRWPGIPTRVAGQEIVYFVKAIN